jgi:hypothetical protein
LEPTNLLDSSYAGKSFFASTARPSAVIHMPQIFLLDSDSNGTLRVEIPNIRL